MAEADVGRAKSTETPAMAPLPSDALIILAVRNTVLFPGLVLPITVGRPGSVAAAQQAVREQRQIGILMQRDAEVADPSPARHASDRHRRQSRALCHGAGWLTPPRMSGRSAISDP